MHATSFHKGAHCDASEILPATDCCPICLWTGTRAPVFAIQSAPTINMLQCPRCRGCSASHMPKDYVLDRYYSQYYAHSQLRTTTANTENFARRVIAPMSDLGRSNGLRILDYGGGDGSLAHAIATRLINQPDEKRHIQIDVVDYELPGVYSDARISVRGYKDIESVQGKYDLVLASAVLEHVPLLNGIIRGLTRLASPGAYFYARTPFMMPLARLIRNFDITYPAHVHDMGSSFWNRFVQTFDLQAELIISRPSLIETTFCDAPVRTVAAFLMKLPSHLELALRRARPTDPIWTLVGGWEVLLRFQR